MKFANRSEIDLIELRLTKVVYAAVCSCNLKPFSEHIQLSDVFLHIILPEKSHFSPKSINAQRIKKYVPSCPSSNGARHSWTDTFVWRKHKCMRKVYLQPAVQPMAALSTACQWMSNYCMSAQCLLKHNIMLNIPSTMLIHHLVDFCAEC